MENYKEKLKTQNLVMSVCIVILSLFTILGFAAELGIITLTPTAGDSHWQSQWRGFISGASIGILGLMVFGLVRNMRAMKDEKKLKKLYIKMHDERTIQLFHNARSAAMSVFLIGGLIAVIITGYFSVTVSITILIYVAVSSVLCMAFKLYYEKKF